MKGVFNQFGLKVGAKKVKGLATLSTFEYKRKDNMLYHMRTIMNGVQPPEDGKYVRLVVDGTLMMSDTIMEKQSNEDFVRNANGDVLIAGLGIGMILYNILDKKEINSITIIEKYQDVIDIVSPYFKHPKITFTCADIMEWRPEKGQKFDTIYFDIWPDINPDNLKQISYLHNQFKGKLNRSNPNSWMDSWMKRKLQRLNRSKYF